MKLKSEDGKVVIELTEEQLAEIKKQTETPEFPPKGTRCFVWDGDKRPKEPVMRYSFGDGRFYSSTGGGLIGFDNFEPIEPHYFGNGEKLKITVNNKIIEVASPNTEVKSSWHDAPTEIKKRLGEGWRLPTKEELNAMYEQLHEKGVGGFVYYYYWSSSEYSTSYAWVQLFGSGFQLYSSKYLGRCVRAVRDVDYAK